MSVKTEQEIFWENEFGSEYVLRNRGEKLLASNVNFFSKIVGSLKKIDSCIEFGANIGMNLRALKILFPEMKQYGIEINHYAAQELEDLLGKENVFTGSINDYQHHKTFDLALSKGVLIHIDPEKLKNAYKALYEASNQYILICEYYNPSPMTIDYRGHKNKLFKRDFCGEMLNFYPDLSLINYGFSYHRDRIFPQDDITWFLMEKMR